MGLRPQKEVQNMSEVKAAVSAQTGEDWKSAPLSELIRHIIDTHHVYLKIELPELSRQVAGAAAENGELRALVPVFQALREELESHMWKEEVVLFPLILTLEAAQSEGTPPPPAHCGTVNNPIRVMNAEHDGAKSALRELRRITSDFAVPPDAGDAVRRLYPALERFEADMHCHIHLEDDLLVPRASALEASLRA
jgi:regulator of cell morphogenesis and NO signaling